jgi:BASS family bile acid:Na+ symporter
MTPLPRLVQLATFAFPAWVLVASLLALYEPGLFTWFSGNLITWGLSAIMLSMGLTLQLGDFRRVVRRPAIVALGVGLQYIVMPGLGWAVASAVGLPTPFAVGLILVSCCPGGVASNVISYLARADVPLSVSLTAVSTSLSVIMTPVLTTLYASSRVDVPAAGLLVSTLQVVIVPIIAGVALRRYAAPVAGAILPVAPLVAVVLITIIVASIIGSSRVAILESGLQLIVAVFLLHSLGFLLGYWFARALSVGVISSRTVSVEVGMQNSGLGVVLAGENFPDPLVAVPSAISSLFHSVIASALAALWRATADRHGAHREPARSLPVD